MERKITLEKLSKEELIQTVHKIASAVYPFSPDHAISAALDIVAAKRRVLRRAKEDQLRALSSEKRKNYARLLETYSRETIADIPVGIIKKAADLLAEAEAAETEMGLLLNAEDDECKES